MTTIHKIVHTESAPAALGLPTIFTSNNLAQAIVANGFVFCSGSIGLNPQTGVVVEGVEAQTEQVFANMDAVLQASNSSCAQIVKTTVFLKDMNDFQTVNKIYAQKMGGALPARSCVEVARLPKDVLVEIECIATVSA
ncbi:hypothetical protein EDD11_010256 [Mortierella claussenii]|nr:hypothetical protein EDD11_010256 [Mortierella claussenii]